MATYGRKALGQTGALNSHFEDVTDELFLGNGFFDSRDLIQVKYEMLRRVRQGNMSVSQAAKRFGFSRVSYYQIQQAYDQNGLAERIKERFGVSVHPRSIERALTRRPKKGL